VYIFFSCFSFRPLFFPLGRRKGGEGGKEGGEEGGRAHIIGKQDE